MLETSQFILGAVSPLGYFLMLVLGCIGCTGLRPRCARILSSGPIRLLTAEKLRRSFLIAVIGLIVQRLATMV